MQNKIDGLAIRSDGQCALSLSDMCIEPPIFPYGSLEHEREVAL